MSKFWIQQTYDKCYEVLNPRAFEISTFHKMQSFNVQVKYFVWNFKGTIQNISPMHWKIYN